VEWACAAQQAEEPWGCLLKPLQALFQLMWLLLGVLLDAVWESRGMLELSRLVVFRGCFR